MARSTRSREGYWKASRGSHVIIGHGNPVVPDVGRCSHCGKKSYESRSIAKKVCKALKIHGDHPVEPYRCHINPVLWHVGGKRQSGA